MKDKQQFATNVVEVDGLVVNYGGATVLSGVSLSVGASEIRAILGASGCGKTTLLKVMVGLLPPVKGRVLLFNRELKDLDSPEAIDILKQVGVLYQNGALLGSLTVGDNIALPLQMHTALGNAAIREIVQLKLTQVGLPDAATLYPRELSGGMRKRAALARALALDPHLLFCDEPSAGLDPVTSAGLDDLLLRLREDLRITIVIVTHELSSIRSIADSVAFLFKGGVYFQGSLAQALSVPSGPMYDFFNRKEAPLDSETSDRPHFVLERTV
jgi:phospholipid/cholesterol/gamma-HCH transport system ATP-binding protein